MIRRRARGVSLFSQTLLLLVASLFVAQGVSVALFLSLRPPRPDFNRLSDVADALAGGRERTRRARGSHDRDRELALRVAATPPSAGTALVGDPRLTARLAQRIGVPAARVRLFFEPDQRATFPFSGRSENGVPIRHGEPIFFDRMVAALAVPGGWRIVETPQRPLIGAWQRRTFLWFMVTALALVPLAWAFARALARPIRRFADAADRMGADPLAPAVPEAGPAELRVAAHALNRMQARLADHLAERTAMIGAIAHDLRTPLARIAFRIEGAPDPLRERVQADVEQMRAMIGATIGFVRGVQAGPRHPVELDALLRRMAADAAELGRPVRTGALAPLTVTGDALAIERLVQNLVDNGVAYGGEVELTLTEEAGAAALRVADRGPGIEPAAVERMFAPFERGDPSRNRGTGGIGLGLTIARSIAHDHGAALTLANRDGGGLVAEVRFPGRWI